MTDSKLTQTHKIIKVSESGEDYIDVRGDRFFFCCNIGKVEIMPHQSEELIRAWKRYNDILRDLRFPIAHSNSKMFPCHPRDE